MNHTRSIITAIAAIAAVAAVLTGALTGCAPATPAPTDTTPPSVADQPDTAAQSGFPRTLEITLTDGSTTQLIIEHEPTAIAALDYESAETIAALGLADRLVLVPEAVLSPAIGGHIDEMSVVPHTFPVAMELAAETVLNADPDLVIMSPRHGNEAAIAQVLEQSGLTTLQLPTSWVSPDTLVTNIDLIGQATGADEAAELLATQIEQGLAEHAADADAGQDRPNVLLLNNQAGRAFITAGQAFPLHLLKLAGAEPSSAQLGIDRTGPISAEQVVEADPAGIVLIDMNGTGDRMFEELLSNPAVAGLPAVAEGRVLRIAGRQVQALGLTDTTEGLDTLTNWVAQLR